MGTTQSKNESQFERALDLFCACPCQPIIQGALSNKATAEILNWKFPASSHFTLNLLHPSSGPYLGTSLWEPLALDDHDDDENDVDSDDGDMLNISHNAAADQEFQPHSHSSPSSYSMTPPRCVNLNTSHEHVSSPSFLIQKTSSFSSPIRWTQTQESTSANSCGVSSVRTGTTTSTECPSSIKGGAGAGEGNEDLEMTMKSCSFAPRKLFDSGMEEIEHEYEYRHEVGPLHSHNSKEEGQAMEACRRSRISKGANSQTLPPPLPPPHEDISPSISTDQSISMRNGVLVHTSTCTSQTMQVSSISISTSTSPKSTITCHKTNLSPSRVSNRYTPDGLERNNMRHVNTLPSFKDAHPIRLKIKESYQGYETQNVQPQEQEGDYGVRSNGTGTGTGSGGTKLEDMNASNLSILSDAEQACFFSYDPYFSLGQYLISTLDGGQYGNGLSVKMGERYMTLQDRHERVWGVMRSRHTWIPSAVIYSPKPRYPSQTPSSHRPCGGMDSMGGNFDKDGVELYPWALVKKHGRRMKHDVSIHMVVDKHKAGGSSTNHDNAGAGGDLVGGLFDKKPMFRSRHGFDGWDNHQHTVVYRVNKEDREVPSCIMVRDPIQRDVFDVTIAPGIDPLMIICYMAVHSKMVSTVS